MDGNKILLRQARIDAFLATTACVKLAAMDLLPPDKFDQALHMRLLETASNFFGAKTVFDVIPMFRDQIISGHVDYFSVGILREAAVQDFLLVEIFASENMRLILCAMHSAHDAEITRARHMLGIEPFDYSEV